MTAPAEILALVEKFREHADAYKSGRYNETQLRREFVDPLFKALGWDVDNEKGWAESYKDVIHEDAIKVGGSTKAPDYCFRIGGVRKFFVETKKPSVNVKGDPTPAFQVRRYAWSAKLPLSIVTDFEEFAVYDCRTRPKKTDKASKDRTLYLTYRDYDARWDEIAGIFSREAILRGAFDKYAASKKKRGTAEVDDEFLKEIERWREALAKNLARRNERLSQRELNFAVQKTIDRIIFLRICEDRGIEPIDQLRGVTNGKNIYPRLAQLFRAADAKYNSGLFHFEREAGRPEAPDEWTLDLAIDDKTLKDIIRHLYYPDSPYEFSVLPADILGQVYERFLGKVIRLTPAHQAKVEEKPEVRKAGGVYYTPTYIVDYIVQNTVGKLVAGKTPREIAARTKTGKPAKGKRPLAVLDPACGSGSFLIGAYQFLLDWHLGWYRENDPAAHLAGKAPKIYEVAGAEGAGDDGADYRLTTAEKKRILLDHIYGVDIDPQAVEVTKLSLLLKVLEGETRETLQRQLFAKERALPDLAGNIKCGNSLIGPDFWRDQQMELFDEEERLRINTFDWPAEFPHIFKGENPGFDAVIGNPPYVRIQVMQTWAPQEIAYFSKTFASAKKGNYDLYVVFVERSLSLFNADGLFGFILPSKFFVTDYGEGLRRIITESRRLHHVVDFKHHQVFDGATTYTCLLFLSGLPQEEFTYFRADTETGLPEQRSRERSISAKRLSSKPWSFASDTEQRLSDKLREGTTELLQLPASISRGTSTGADTSFMLRTVDGGYTTRDGIPVDVEPEILRIPIYATDFNRYEFRPTSGERVIFPYHVRDDACELMSEAELKHTFPKCFKYLKSRKTDLLARKQYREWFAYSAPRNLVVHERAQIMIPLLADKGIFCRLPDDMSPYCPMASGGFSVALQSADGAFVNFVLGLVNSRLLFWRLASISNVFRGGWITCTKQYFGKLPIKAYDSSSAGCKRIASAVSQNISLREQLASAKTPHGRNTLERQIAATDAEIDRLVYELYGLTDEEIRLVEEATS